MTFGCTKIKLTCNFLAQTKTEAMVIIIDRILYSVIFLFMKVFKIVIRRFLVLCIGPIVCLCANDNNTSNT